MQALRCALPSLSDLTPYDPKYLPARVYLNANESPYGLPPRVTEDLQQGITRQALHRYPDPLAKSLRTKIAQFLSVSDENVLLGNGGDELIFNIALAYGGSGRKLLIAPPSFSSYEIDAQLTSTELVKIKRRISPCSSSACTYERVDNSGYLEYRIDEKAVISRVSQGDIDIVMLTSPNNPTGDALDADFVSALLEASDALVLIDQAYQEFSDARYDVSYLLKQHKNLAILRTFSKAYALAGVRLGYLIATEELIHELCKVRQPYSVDTFSAHAGLAVMNNREAFSRQIEESITERRRVTKALKELPGIEVFVSEANFVLIRLAQAHRIWRRLYEDQGILLRDFSASPGLADCLRISIGRPDENDELIGSLGDVLKGES